MQAVSTTGILTTAISALGLATRTVKADDCTDPACWATYDPGENGVGTESEGIYGGVFDGQYVCLAPFFNEHPSAQAEFLRHQPRCDVPGDALTNLDCWGSSDAKDDEPYA